MTVISKMTIFYFQIFNIVNPSLAEFRYDIFATNANTKFLCFRYIQNGLVLLFFMMCRFFIGYAIQYVMVWYGYFDFFYFR